MSYGLEVFNSSGALTLDISERLSQVITYGQVTVPAGSGVNITVSGMAQNNGWFVFVCPANFSEPSDAGFNVLHPVIYSGYFRINNGGAVSYTVKYSVYRR